MSYIDLSHSMRSVLLGFWTGSMGIESLNSTQISRYGVVTNRGSIEANEFTVNWGKVKVEPVKVELEQIWLGKQKFDLKEQLLLQSSIVNKLLTKTRGLNFCFVLYNYIVIVFLMGRRMKLYTKSRTYRSNLCWKSLQLSVFTAWFSLV